jgi:hypothetical protein
VGQFWVRWWEELCHSRLFRALRMNRGRWIFEMRWCVGGWFLSAPMGGGFSSCADGWMVSQHASGGREAVAIVGWRTAGWGTEHVGEEF